MKYYRFIIICIAEFILFSFFYLPSALYAEPQGRSMAECQDVVDKILNSTLHNTPLEKYNLFGPKDLPFNYQTLFKKQKRIFLTVGISICEKYTILKQQGTKIDSQCIYEKLTAADNQVEDINEVIDTIRTEDQAKEKKNLLTGMFLYFAKQFSFKFEQPCDEPVLTFFKFNMKKYKRGLISRISKRLEEILLLFPSPPLKQNNLSIHMDKFSNASVFDKEILKTALMYAAQDDMATALNILEFRKKFDKNSPELHYILANIYSLLPNHEKQALNEYTYVIKTAPRFYNALYYRGNILSRLGKKTEAIKMYEEVIDIAPDFSLAWYKLAKTYYEIGDFDSALKFFITFNNNSPDLYLSWYYQGIIYSKKGDHQKAINSLNKALSLNRLFFDTYAALSLAIKKKNDIKSFISQLEKEKKEKHFSDHTLLGALYMEQMEYDKAEKEINQAIVKYPNPASYIYLGLLEQKKGDFKKAASQFEKAIQINPLYAKGYVFKGEALIHDRRGVPYGIGFNAKEAEKAFLKAIDIDWTYTEAYNRLGRLYLASGKSSKASYQFIQAIQIDPFYVDSYINLYTTHKKRNIQEDEEKPFKKSNLPKFAAFILDGLTYQSLGQVDSAATQYENALLVSNPVSYHFLGDIYLAKREYKKAVKEYLRSLAFNPHAIEACYNIGVAYLESGDDEKALSFFTHALNQDNGYAKAYYGAGLVYRKRFSITGGDIMRKKAGSNFLRALKQNPFYFDAMSALINLYKEGGDLYKQINFTRKKVAASPDALLHNLLGYSYQQIGRDESALLQFNKAIAIEPNYISYGLSGFLYNKSNDSDNAIAAFEKAVVISPNSLSYISLGDIYVGLSQYSMARQQYKRAVTLNPLFLPARLKLARIYEQNEKGEIFGEGFLPDKAIEQYRLVLSIAPGHGEAVNRLKKLNAQIEKGKISGSTQYIYKENKQKRSPGLHQSKNKKFALTDDALRHFMLAALMRNKGDFNSAIELYTRAIEKSPAMFDSYFELGKIYEKKGMFEKSFRTFNTAVNKNHEMAEGYRHMGKLYSLVRDYKKAILAYTEAIKQDPDFPEAYRNLISVYEAMGDMSSAKGLTRRLKTVIGGGKK